MSKESFGDYCPTEPRVLIGGAHARIAKLLDNVCHFSNNEASDMSAPTVIHRLLVTMGCAASDGSNAPPVVSEITVASRSLDCLVCAVVTLFPVRRDTRFVGETKKNSLKE